MLTERMQISLEPDELKVLIAMCNQDYRPPREQIRWLVMQEAIRRGIQAGTDEISAGATWSPLKTKDEVAIAS